jgi:hypothetical protein
MSKQLVCEQIGTSHANVFESEAEIWGTVFGERCLGGLAQSARLSRGGDISNHAVARSQIFIDCPGLALSGEGTEQRVPLYLRFTCLSRSAKRRIRRPGRRRLLVERVQVGPGGCAYGQGLQETSSIHRSPNPIRK